MSISTISTPETARKVAENLLKIQAVFLSPKVPFTWASGIKSPIYCDNRLTIGVPAVRTYIAEAFCEAINLHFSEAEIIVGTATSGIPHATLVADKMNKPLAYTRGKAKEHGRGKQTEGAEVNGKKVVVVEDLISTAGSSLEVVEALKEEGATVLGIVSIFTYTLKKGIDKLTEANVQNVSLSDINYLLDVALTQNYIDAQEKRMVESFIQNTVGDWQSIK